MVPTKIAVFEDIKIRKVLHEGEWFFSVVDVAGVLSQSQSVDSGAYWRKLKQRLIEEGSEVVTKCHTLKLKAPDGKMRDTDCANTETLFRIIQSIPSPKAEPFKQWLAQVGYERVQEIEDPELSMKRMYTTYEKKGYPKEWIELRMKGIDVRKELTDEWNDRGGEKAYGILTNEVYQAYTGMDNEAWKKYKGIKSGNLRDGMTPTELILTMLAEQSTKEITKVRDAQGLPALKKAGKDGGGVALKARRELAAQTGKDPISGENYLENVKKLPKKRK